MTQHTPGPWQLNGSTISGKDPLDLRGNYNESPVCTISHGWRNSDIDSANARLITKAPEILALFKRLADTLDALQCPPGTQGHARVWEARALLREIEGEAI